MARDEHGQPVTEFRRRQNSEKLLNDLLGLCEGLVADQTLSAEETAFLDAWLKESRGLLANDPDFIDIQDCVQDALADGHVSEDELDDLLGLLDCVVRNRGASYAYDSADAAIQRLLGLSKGLIADRRLNDREIHFLHQWARRCGPLREQWPLSIIAKRLDSILEDGIISDDEREDLVDTLSKLTGGAFVETGAAAGVATRAFEADGFHADPVVFTGNSFLLTGKFIFGSRSRCAEAITERGGALAAGVNKSLNYLVVGTLSSRDWAHEAFGRKIEAAVALRSSGCPVAVISEEHWTKYLQS